MMDFVQKIVQVRRNQLSSTELKKLQLCSLSEENSRDYVRGAIVRVKLENFLPYEKIELFPGPYLNLVIGPNGSGKSALVCGICLGLGGKVSTIGRASHLSDYIRRGKDKAITEIELYNPQGRNWIISREISHNSNWKLNGQLVGKKEIDKILTDLSIQVDNLCQFLPQDRVADFAKMSQQELLLNTERAIGPDLYKFHVELKQFDGEVRVLHESIQCFEERLKAERERKEQLEVKVQNYNEREKHIENIRLLKKKRPWIEYEMARQDYVEQNKVILDLNSTLNKLKKEDVPFVTKLNETVNAMNNCGKEMTTLNSGIHNYIDKIASGQRQIQECNEKVKEIEDNLKLRILEQHQQKQRLETLRQQLDGLENELSRVTEDQGDEQPLINQVNRECHDVASCLLSLQNEKEKKKAFNNSKDREKRSVECELQRFQDVRQRRLDIVRQKHRHTYEAVLWLQDNKNEFKKKIYEPIMTLINVTDQKYVKYLEAHISFNDMITFVCEDAEDLKKFLSILRDSKKLKINAALAPRAKLESFQPLKPIGNFKQWGFYSYLNELFTAPEAVMAFLCLLYRMHEIPVGNEYTEHCVENIVKKTNFRKFYTSNFVFSSRRSLYGQRNLSTMSVELKTPTLLTIFKDDEKRQYLEKELQRLELEVSKNNEQFAQLQEKEKSLTVKQELLRNKKKELLKKRDLKKTLSAKIRQKKESIDVIQSQVIDIETEQAKSSEKILKITKERLKTLSNISSTTKDCFQQHMKKFYVAIKKSTLLDKKLKMEQKHQDTAAAIQELEVKLKQNKNIIDVKKKNAEQLLSVANKISGLKDAAEIHSKLSIAFKNLPSTLTEVDDLLCAEQAKVDCLGITDESVLQEHLKKRQAIDLLERRITEKKEDLNLLEKKIAVTKEQWLPKLETLIEKIDANFSRYFTIMGCAGEVALHKGNNPEDFDNYGIAIKVKYRVNERLKELTQSYHSGGECSVATALYMIALQSLTKVPFRCIDEINQGMDAENERRVFDFLVNTACLENSSQYFILTPKLLPNLKYTKNIKVHIIHSGTRSLNCE